MKRKTLYLGEQQVKNLKKTARKTGLNVSELIRRSIDEFLKKENKNA